VGRIDQLLMMIDPVPGTDFGSLFLVPQHCRIWHFRLVIMSIYHTITGRALFGARCYASAVMRCLSVPLSRSWILSKRINIILFYFIIF